MKNRHSRIIRQKISGTYITNSLPLMKKTVTYSLIYIGSLACLSWLIYEDFKSDNKVSLIISLVSIIIGTIAYIRLMMKYRKC